MLRRIDNAHGRKGCTSMMPHGGGRVVHRRCLMPRRRKSRLSTMPHAPGGGRVIHRRCPMPRGRKRHASTMPGVKDSWCPFPDERRQWWACIGNATGQVSRQQYPRRTRGERAFERSRPAGRVVPSPKNNHDYHVLVDGGCDNHGNDA